MSLFYNIITNELGILVTVNKMLLIDFGYGRNIYKVFTKDWIKVGVYV